jgi:phosphoglycolate phosphatase-like HAD superfamily hydrolase
LGGGSLFILTEAEATMTRFSSLVAAGLLAGIATASFAQRPSGDHVDDPLPSWNDGEAKKALVAFVARVTREGTPDFVPPDERIAVFDNDGTLWAEQPAYFQLLFAVDRVKALAPDHPEWRATEPYQSVLAGDMKAMVAQGEKGIVRIVAATHSGITTGEFNSIVRDWLATAKHPTTGRLYKDMIYQPMLEVLDYLRASGFKTFIVSGGGIEFLRAFAEEAYGIPPEQVIGSSGKVMFEMRDGVPVLVKQPEINFIDDKEGKPVGINQHIGRRPIIAFGNSDGDLEMLQYTTISRGRDDTTPRFGLIIHHTDAQREWAYDRDSHVGRLDKALDEAKTRGWVVIDMKADWKVIFP